MKLFNDKGEVDRDTKQGSVPLCRKNFQASIFDTNNVVMIGQRLYTILYDRVSYYF